MSSAMTLESSADWCFGSIHPPFAAFDVIGRLERAGLVPARTISRPATRGKAPRHRAARVGGTVATRAWRIRRTAGRSPWRTRLRRKSSSRSAMPSPGPLPSGQIKLTFAPPARPARTRRRAQAACRSVALWKSEEVPREPVAARPTRGRVGDRSMESHRSQRIQSITYHDFAVGSGHRQGCTSESFAGRGEAGQ
jgi:hypothetical protein